MQHNHIKEIVMKRLKMKVYQLAIPALLIVMSGCSMYQG